MHEIGKNPQQVYRKEDIVIWHSTNDEAEDYIAVFNLKDNQENVSLSLKLSANQPSKLKHLGSGSHNSHRYSIIRYCSTRCEII